MEGTGNKTDASGKKKENMLVGVHTAQKLSATKNFRRKRDEKEKTGEKKDFNV